MALFNVIENINNYINKEEYVGTFLLQIDNWNDWWEYKTLFNMFYINKIGDYIRLGYLKIADEQTKYNYNIKEVCKPKIPHSFDKLDESFFTLGQSREYYENLLKLSNAIEKNLFIPLRDISYRLDIYEKVKDKHVTKRSLKRDVSDTTIKSQFHRISNGGAVLTKYDFAFKYRQNIKSLQKKFNIMSCQVNPKSIPATNIHVIIGRNGAGKTRLLHNMVKSYLDENTNDYFVKMKYEYDHSEGKIEKKLIEENCDKDIFPNLIYSSYNAFDDMKILYGKNYSYLGLRKEVQQESKISYKTKNIDELTIEFINSFRNCMTYEKAPRLSRALKMLEFDLIFADAKLSDFLNVNKLIVGKKDEEMINKLLEKRFEKFSTGHRVILITITKLVDSLEEQSLVLLDEPENHLHPPLLSAFIRCLSDLLFNRNAVAIIATHSSIVLQEVPRKCVWKINRSGYESSIKRPSIETFGTSHSDLNEEVFRVDIEKTGFHQLIKTEVGNCDSFNQLYERFEGQIGEEAEILARTLFYIEDKAHES